MSQSALCCPVSMPIRHEGAAMEPAGGESCQSALICNGADRRFSLQITHTFQTLGRADPRFFHSSLNSIIPTMCVRLLWCRAESSWWRRRRCRRRRRACRGCRLNGRHWIVLHTARTANADFDRQQIVILTPDFTTIIHAAECKDEPS